MATTTTALLRPGDVLGGFRVDDVIGIGGMAIVYRAVQVSLGRPVALKVLSSKLTSDAVFRERFRREGTHAASLEHPNIVPVYDSGEQDGHLYLAMRLVEGTNLAELIQTRGVTADQTIEILRPIASALDTAHAAGLIHRDVKPQNILITAQGHPYLADFGVAKGSNTSGLTATGGFVGSVNYASPEQIKGLTLTSASDVYALTAVLYQCLTGHVPYPRETDAGVMHAQLTEPPPTLPTITGADSDFHTVLARGMAKDPGARYGHAGDLINAAALSVSRLPTRMRKAVPAFPSDTTDVVPSAPVGAAQTGNAGLAEPGRRRPAPELTTADQRRDPAPQPEPQAAGFRLRRPVIAAAVGCVALVIAAVAMLLGSGATKMATVQRGLIQLSYTKPWRETTAKIPVADVRRFEDAIGLAAPTAGLTAGTLVDSGPVPGSLPPGLLTHLDKAPRKSIVRVGAATATRYDATAQRGAVSISLLVIATTRGDLGLLCSSPTHTGLQSCVQVAQTVRAVGAVPPGADPSLAQNLSKVLAASAAARADQRNLVSSRLADRAAAARMIAAADGRSAKSLGLLSAEPRDQRAVKVLASAFMRETAALANAAGSRDEHGYATDVVALDAADRVLVSAIAKLRAMGFVSLPSLPSLHPAPYPRAHHPHPHKTPAATPAPSAPATTAPPSQPAVVSEPAPAPAPSAPEHSTPSPSHHSESPQTVVSAPK